MEVHRRDGEFVVCAAPSVDRLRPLATVLEDEGLTVVVTRDEADREGLGYGNTWAWITVAAATGLTDVGVTAALSAALAEASIACNVLAGLRHDHMLVPSERAEEALAVLGRLRA